MSDNPFSRRSTHTSGSPPCRYCNAPLPRDHVGLTICKPCLDGETHPETCTACGKIYQAGRLDPRDRTPQKLRCPGCIRKRNKALLHEEGEFPPDKVLTPAERELARRQLARKYLIYYILRFDSKYQPGWVHKDLAARLQRFVAKVANGESPRLMVQMPPRHGKSRLTSEEFSGWVLGLHPDWEIIASSYAVSLPIEFSRRIRDRLRDEAYKSVFPSSELHPESQSVESWRTTKGGGFLAAGVGGAITGKGAHILIIDDPCIAAGSLVVTQRGDVPIESVVPGDLVLTHRNRWRQVTAVHDNGDREVVQLITDDGKHLRLTPEHLVYTSAGWVPVIEATDVHTLQTVRKGIQGAAGDAAVLQHSVLGGVPKSASQTVPGLPAGVPAPQRNRPEVLRPGLRNSSPRHPQNPELPSVRGGLRHSKPGAEVLLPRVPHGAKCRSYKSGEGSRTGATYPAPAPRPPQSSRDGSAPLRLVRRVFRAVAHIPAGVLFFVQKRAARRANEGAEQPEFPAWNGSRRPSTAVPKMPESLASAGVSAVRDVWEYGIPGGAPSGRRSDQRLIVESDRPLQLVPHPVSQVTRCGVARVYDLTVEEDHSFVAGGVVVHNCKNAEEAESQTIRNATWNWYTSTAYTRLAPGGGVLIIQTRWHSDDLSGRIERTMLEENGEEWEIVRYPAIAREDEPFRKAGEPLHPERYSLEALRRIEKAVGPRTWNALYQQNPVPDEGAYFTRDMVRYYEKTPEVLAVFNTWDLAIGQKQQNDWTVGLQWGVDPNDDIYLLALIRGRFDSKAIVENMLNLWKRDPRTEACGIEEGQIKMAIGPYLEQRVAERRVYNFHQVPLKPGRQDKMARARTIQGRMEQGKVFLPKDAEWLEKFMDELTAFPFGRNDDQVDALAYAGIMASEVSAPSIQAGKNLDTRQGWKTKMAKFLKRPGKARSWKAA